MKYRINDQRAIILLVLCVSAVPEVLPKTGKSEQPFLSAIDDNSTRTRCGARLAIASKPLTHNNQLSSAPPAQSRISELLSQNGAKLPLKLQALTPKMDTSGAKPVLLTGAVSKSGSFPQDWQGQWKGILTIKVFQYNPICARFDPAEFAQTQSLMRPGTSGAVTFEFSQGSDRKIELQPAQVYFSKPSVQNHFIFESSKAQASQQDASSPGPGWLKIGRLRPVASPPFRYILHLGLYQTGIGVTGNTLSGNILSDTVKTLAPDVIEQQVLAYESDVSRLTGSVGHAFSESDIQFTAEDQDTLKVEAASVRYGPDGEFVDKVILQGEVRRDSQSLN